MISSDLLMRFALGEKHEEYFLYPHAGRFTPCGEYLTLVDTLYVVQAYSRLRCYRQFALGSSCFQGRID